MPNNHDWQSLVELSGLLVSDPVLRERFPDGPQPLDAWLSRRFRTEYERWQGAEARREKDADAADRALRRWIDFGLTGLLGYDAGRLRSGQALPLDVIVELTDYMQTLKPTMALMDGSSPLLLVYVADGDLDRPEQVTGRWKASPFTKLDRLLRETRVQLGILTNGQDWRLVYAAPGLPTSYITWTASGWSDERSTLQAFAMLLHNPTRLLEMAAESQQRQADVTDQLGNQVLAALAIFVRELDAADKSAGGGLLEALSPEAVYEMALFLMMRLVFIFYAEENGLLPHGDVFYDQAYGLTYLWNRLERERQMDEERFAQRHDAWPGLLATFRLIHNGCSHPDFAMVAYGGALFDPDRFRVLENEHLRITNEALWRMLRQLTTAEGRDGRQRVSYRALQVEQLGYVYENLLGYTVRAAKEPMLQPNGGVEAFPLANFQNALAEGKLYDYFKSVTRLHWSQARSLAGEAEERAQKSDDTGWVFAPVADAWVDPGDRYVAFQMGTRKRGGIFYTPPQLTSFLVEQALRPQCYDDPDSDNPRVRDPKHILALTVCDPAMGSGAFLVQAVRYLAERLLEAWDAAVAEAGGQTLVMPYAQPERAALDNYGPIPTDRAEALAWARRLVAERCIYGVDLNPLAVELAKLSLWLVTLSKDKPFTFLDHRLRHGNSLIGASFYTKTAIEIGKRRPKTYPTQSRTTLFQIQSVLGEALKPSKDTPEPIRSEMWQRLRLNRKYQELLAAGQTSFADIQNFLDFVYQILFIPDDALYPHANTPLPIKEQMRQRLKHNQIAVSNLVVGQTTIFANLQVDETLSDLEIRREELEQPTFRAEDYEVKTHKLRDTFIRSHYLALKQIADLWCAVWFWPRDLDVYGLPPTTDEYRDAMYDTLGRLQRDVLRDARTSDHRLHQIHATAEEIAQREAFLHWELEFPEIFARDNPGFDAVVGNPPWEIVKPNSQEFFEVYDPGFRRYGKQEALRVAEALAESDPTIARAWEQYKTSEEQKAHYFNADVAYLFQGRGDLNTYKLFTEHVYQLSRKGGYFSLIVPSGIYTDLGTKELRQLLFDSARIDCLFAYENREMIFPIDIRFKFTLLTAEIGSRTEYFRAAFMRHHLSDLAHIRETAIVIDPHTVHRFSPDSLSIMEFRSQRDVDIVARIYSGHPFLGEDISGVWSIEFRNGFHMTNDSHMFNAEKVGLPLYEGKMIWHFDAYFGEPRYWISEEIGRLSLTEGNSTPIYETYRLAFRRIAQHTNERTLTSAIIPKFSFIAESAPYHISQAISNQQLLFLLSCFNSFVLDYVVRQKITANLNTFQLYQLPIPRLTIGNSFFDALFERAMQLTCTSHHFADLWQEVTGEPWPDDPYMCPPPRSGDPEIDALRQRLRDEIDVLVAHLYGLSREDFVHILSTFPLVFPPYAKLDKTAVLDASILAGDDTKPDDINPKMQNLLEVYDEFAEITRGWERS